MRDKIIEHMNEGHEEALLILVKCYNDKKDAFEAVMTDLDSKGMKILVNNTDEVFVPFRKEIEMEKVKSELMYLLKNAREKLGIEKKSTEESVQGEMDAFIDGFDSILLGTVDSNNDPNITYAPYLKYKGENYIYISEIGDHYNNLEDNGKLEVMFLEDESKAKAITVRGRIRYKSGFEFLERDAKFDEVMDEFEKKAGKTMAMIRNMLDFHLVKLNFLEGRFVKGFGQAYLISADGKINQLTGDNVNHRTK